MKKIMHLEALLAAIAMAVASSQNASATLFFTDQFNYPDNSNLGTNSSCPWNTVTAGTGDNSAQIKVTAASAQTSPSGFDSAAFNGVVVAPAASNKKNAAKFNGATGVPVADGNVVYASFLLNVQTKPVSGNMRVAYLHNTTASSAAIEVVVSSTGQVGIQKKGSGTTFVTGTPVVSAGTHLVVMRYKFQAGADEVAVWVDPDSSTYSSNSAPATSTGAATTGGGSDMANAFLYIAIDSPNLAAGPVFWIDEVRVGDTWGDVTPGTGTCDAAGVTSDPANATVEVGSSTNFTIIATGTSRTYQWQVSTDTGSSWNNTSTGTNSTTASYTTGPATTSENGYQYRCIVNVACDTSSATSGVATLTVNCTTAGIGSHPSSIGVNAGQTANFTVTATGSSPSYQWEFSTDSGTNWSSVVTGTGGNTASHTTAATTTGENGYQYRCIVNVACDSSSVTSLVATLTVSCTTAGITDDPNDGAVPEGSTANFAVTATGSSPAYQWELSTDGGTIWSPVGVSTNSYTTPATISTDNGNKYRCIVSVACDSSSVTSAVATLTVVAPASTSFRSAASGRWQDTSTWELSGDNGATWFPASVMPTAANCTNILVAAGKTVANLSSVTADQIVVAAGGTLNVSNTLTVAAGSTVDLDVHGTLVVLGGSSALTLQSGVVMVVESGGVFAHDGTSSAGVNNSGSITNAAGGTFQLRRAGGNIPIATWAPGSTCEIAYSTASSSRPGDAGTAQTFENFVWNNPLQSAGIDLAGKLTNVNGNFILVASAGHEVKWNGDANFGGNIVVSNGLLNVSGNATPRIWTLKGDLIIASGGTFNVSATASATNQLILTGTGTQNYTCDGANLATKLFWTVDAGSTLNLNSDLPMTASGRTLTANGTVNLNGKTLLTDIVAGTGTVRNEGGGTGLLVVGVNNNATNTLDGTLALLNGTSGTLGLAKGAGSGLLTISAPHTFSGGLVVSNGTVLVNNVSGSGTGGGNVTVVDGTLGGTGTIAGSVNVESAGNLAPGASIDDLTINGTLTLGGTFTAEVNTGAAPNTDQVIGTSAVNYGGTLQIVNQGAALTTSDTFQIFPAGTRLGTFVMVPATPDNNAGLAWNTSTLTTDGTLRISTVAVGPDTTPTNIVSSVSGGNLTLTWPSSHIGWTLQAQTNSRSVGLSSNWTAYDGGYATTNEAVILIEKTSPTVFFRLFYQIP